MSALDLAQIAASYGQTRAVFDVSLTVRPGSVHALLGRNGMGKTTTIRAICGMLPLAGGTVRFAGSELGGLPSHRIARLGIGLVPEGRRCFARLSVHENLVATARNGAWTLRRVTGLFPRLGERLEQSAGTLSGGEQQMLAIGRALMTNPRLLILDEATEGLAPIVRQEIWAAIRALRTDAGLSILLVDKSLAELRALADDATILQSGRSVWSAPMGTLTPEIAAQYLGL